MTKNLSELAVVVDVDDTIDATIRKMAAMSRQVTHVGLALILDESNKLLGILTDGDLRRAYAKGVDFFSPVSTIMVKDPITIPASMPSTRVISEIYRRVREAGRHSSESIRHVLLVDKDNILMDVVDFLDLLQQEEKYKKVAVFGLGYVGLTLAVSLANRGHLVTGVDLNAELVEQLLAGEPHILEPGLKDMLNVNQDRKQITFTSRLGEDHHSVYIIAVSTPLNEDNLPSLDSLNDVLHFIASRLRRGDQIMLRSTVPVGTTREVVIPLLEKMSALKAGEDFHVTFAPERTVEGRAMYELQRLPQIIGAYSPSCMRHSSEFWSSMTPSIVRTASLEASEIVKLANNTFRDLSFAFANEIAFLADQYNVDAFEVIRAANDGYPRNPIPTPSPGVGGYCLTKDPLIFNSTPFAQREGIILGKAGRRVNENAMKYVVSVVERFAKRINKPISELSVLIVGLAFKGEPETTDLRGSASIEIAKILSGSVKSLSGWDAVITPQVIESQGMIAEENLDVAIQKNDVILILNNHPENVPSETYVKPSKSKLIFDGWHQLHRNEIEKIDGLVYATMGYMTTFPNV